MKNTIISLVVLVIIIAAGWFVYTKLMSNKAPVSQTPPVKQAEVKDLLPAPVAVVQETKWTPVIGMVKTVFEGEWKLVYTFNIPEKAVLLEKPQHNFDITLNSKNIAHVLFTYEGGRGYSPTDYVNEELKKTNKTITTTSTTVGTSTWTLATDGTKEWFINYGDDKKQWLVIIDGAKVDHAILKHMAETYKGK